MGPLDRTMIMRAQVREGMGRLARIFLLICGLVVWPGLSQVWANEEGSNEEGSNEWQFTFAPYIWFASLDGKLGVRGRTADVDASFLDVLENSDSVIGFLGYAEVRKGKWGVFVDSIYADVGTDTATVGPLSVDTQMQAWFFQFGALYRIFGRSPAEVRGGGPEDAWQKLVVDAYLGGRYSYMDGEIDSRINLGFGPGLGRVVGRTEDWIDPIIGLRTVFSLTPKLKFNVKGDIGGFGVGSHFAYQVQALLGYHFPLFGIGSAVWAGYRALYQNFDTGMGANQFVYDMTMHGPITGLSFHF